MKTKTISQLSILGSLFFLFCHLSATTYIGAVQNNSGEPVTIKFISAEKSAPVSVWEISAQQDLIIPQELCFPINQTPFTQVTDAKSYLEITTKMGTFYCVEGNQIPTPPHRTVRWGVWMQREGEEQVTLLYRSNFGCSPETAQLFLSSTWLIIKPDGSLTTEFPPAIIPV